MASERNIRIELNFSRTDLLQRRVGSILEALPRGAKRNYIMRLMAQDSRLSGSPKAVAKRVAAHLQESMMGQNESLENEHKKQLERDGALSRPPDASPLRHNQPSEPLSRTPKSEPLHGDDADRGESD